MLGNLIPNAPVGLDWCVLFCLTTTLVVSAITDLRSRKIYNLFTYSTALFCFGIALLNWLLHGLESPFRSESISLMHFVGGFFGCFGVMLVIHVLGGGGAGDVKLAAAIGSAIGFSAGLQVIGYTYLITAAVMISKSVFQKGVRSFIGALFRSVGSRLMPFVVSEPTEEDQELLKREVPLGPGFLGGFMIVCWDYGVYSRLYEAFGDRFV